jgi:DNA uptake protein ComE-like DNA-binding protein
LVDVNHAPLEYLVQLGVDRSTAEQIADVRDGIGGFTSVDDVSVTLGLHPHALDQAASRLIFIR